MECGFLEWTRLIDFGWILFFLIPPPPLSGLPSFLFRWNFSLFDFLGYSFFPRMSGGINPSTHVSFNGYIIMVILFSSFRSTIVFI